MGEGTHRRRAVTQASLAEEERAVALSTDRGVEGRLVGRRPGGVAVAVGVGFAIPDFGDFFTPVTAGPSVPASIGIGTVQNKPLAAIPGSKSWSWMNRMSTSNARVTPSVSVPRPRTSISRTWVRRTGVRERCRSPRQGGNLNGARDALEVD